MSSQRASQALSRQSFTADLAGASEPENNMFWESVGQILLILFVCCVVLPWIAYCTIWWWLYDKWDP